MSEWKIYSINGVERAQVKELELHDEWMAECYLTVTVKRAEPVSFQIGDYIDYRGERYCINYDPRVLKKARSSAYGEGFVYDNIKFVSEPQSKIVGCDFTDIVLNDNQLHYTGLPTFPFYCESVDDLLDRVQACLEELYPGRFILIGLNTVRNAQRGLLVGRQQAFINAYKQYIDPTGAERTASYGKRSVALTVDNITCWEALTKVNSEFGLNFIMRGDVVIVGTDGAFTAKTFRYGKGNGLYEIERISEEDQQVITRLKAYGSEENLPSRYYAELNMQVFAHVVRIDNNYATSGIHYASFWLDLDYNQKYFTERSQSYPGYDDVYNYIVRITANGITVKGFVSKSGSSNRCYVYCEYTGPNPDDDRDETDEQAMNAFSEAISQGDTVYFVGGVEKSAFPAANKYYATANLPNNMAVSRLMLPGFPNQSLYAWVKAHGGTDCNDTTGQATINGFTGYFSKDSHRPWIQSLKADEYGIRPGNIYFDGSDDTENIHPTLEGMTYLGNAVDVVVAAEQITDNGVFGEGDVPNFTITLPNLGFNLSEYYEDGATIDMKDGMCGSRSFKMASRPTKNNNNQWVCKVERVKDESLDLWFPYSDFQIHSGDHYVLTGISLPDEYVAAASERLLYAAIEALQKNDSTRFTYQPRIDEIWMARQDDAVKGGYDMATYGTVSLHDTLHAGDIFLFADTDLGIDEGIIIDVLTIREGGNNGVPTYEVTLRDEKQVSAIQRMIDKTVSDNNGSGSGGYTSKQIQSLVENYGSSNFLSKKSNDSAEGIITFLKGLISNSIKSDPFAPMDGLAGNGFKLWYGDGRGQLQVDDLYVLGRMLVNTMEIREVSYIGGVYLLTPAASTVQRIMELHGSTGQSEYSHSWAPDGASEDVFGYRLLWKADDGTTSTMNYWQVGDMAFCEVFGIQESGVYNNFANRRWWRLVTRTGLCLDDGTIIGSASDIPANYDGSVWHFTDVSNISAVMLWDGTSDYIMEGSSYKMFAGYEGYNGATNPNAVPQEEDKAICLGSLTTATRRGAVQIKATGESNDVSNATIDIFDGINDYAALSTFEVHHFGKDAVRMSARRFQWTTAEGTHQDPTIYMGDWASANKSFWGYEWDYNESRWLCVIPSNATGATVGTMNGAKYTTEAPGTTAAWWKEVKGEKGDTGTAGETTAMLFKQEAHGTTVYAPQVTAANYMAGTNLNGWSKSAPNRTDGYDIWMSQNVVLTAADGTYSLKSVSWSTPARISGDQGPNGTSPYFADLDNEMDSVACDVDGKPVQISGSDQSVSTMLSLWHGTTELALATPAIKRNGTTVTLGTKTSGVTVTWNSTTNVLTVTYDGASDTQAVINGKDEYGITLTASTDNTITRDLTFTVNGVRPGANGEPAVIYQLKPSLTSIQFSRLDDDTLTPISRQVSLIIVKSVGGTITEYSTILAAGVNVRYSTSTMPASSSAGTSWGTSDGTTGLSWNNGVLTVSNSVGIGQLYIAMFNRLGTLLDRETIPVVKDGLRGPQGEDGANGITLSMTPSALLLTQGETSPYNINYGDATTSKEGTIYVSITAKRDGSALSFTLGNNPVTSGINNSNYMCTAYCRVVSDTELRVWVTAVNTANGNNQGKCLVTFTVGGETITAIVPWYANLLGTWKQSIENGIEESISDHLLYVLTDGDEGSQGTVTETTQVGTFIRGWAENTSTLFAASYNTKNMMDVVTGWESTEGDLSTITYDPSTFKIQDSNDDLYSPVIMLEPNTNYCFSAKFDSEPDSNYSQYGYVDVIYYQHNSDIIEADDVVLMHPQWVRVGTTNRYYFAFTTPNDGKKKLFVFNYWLYPTSIYEPQLEHGSTPSDFVPSFYNESSVSRFAQTAQELDMSIRDDLGETGINISGPNKTINLQGNKVTFSNSAGTVSGKIWIDPDDGSLHAVDGKFSGNIYTPYKRLTSNNIGEYETEDFYGSTVINLAKTGLNIQVEVPRENPDTPVYISLPKITADMLGCEVNIFNASGAVIIIEGGGRAGQISSGGYFAALIKPSAGLGVNQNLELNAGYEARLKAIHNPYMIQHENYQYSWLCCYVNINP